MKDIKIFLLGDFSSNTGPALANRAILQSLHSKNVDFSLKKNILSRIVEIIKKTSKNNLIILASFSAQNIIAILVSKLLRKKTYYIMHGWTAKESKINGTYKKKNEVIENFIFNNVDIIICLTETFKDNFIIHKPHLEKKIKIYGNKIIDHEKQDIPVTKQREKNSIKMICTGGFMPIKNNYKICQAILTYNKTHDMKIELAVYGVKKTDRKYDFDNSIKLFENISHESLMKEFKKSDIYIQNSYFETFGLAAIEAVLQGCNLILSNKMGCLSLLKSATKNEIVQNNEEIDDIIKKIEYVVANPNNKKYYNDILDYYNNQGDFYDVLSEWYDEKK